MANLVACSGDMAYPSHLSKLAKKHTEPGSGHPLPPAGMPITGQRALNSLVQVDARWCERTMEDYRH